MVAGFVTSSSSVPLKTRRVGRGRCTLNLSRAETSSRWLGQGGVPAQVTSTSFDHGSKLRGPSPKEQCDVNIHSPTTQRVINGVVRVFSHYTATRELLTKDLVILNLGQIASRTPELASPLQTTRHRQQENFEHDRFKHSSAPPTMRVLSGTTTRTGDMPATSSK
ncbi:hypothetical protein TNCV_1981151 [Trichonephila clavipes]|nr:hypothetical protein TNCV_1981151 [Trichonephila clavipes]